MKKLLVIIAIVLWVALWFVSFGMTEELNLTASETVSVPTYQKMVWKISGIEADNKRVEVTYKMISSTTGQPIQTADSNETWKKWVCLGRLAQKAADCTEEHIPYPGCTGAGTGENLDPGDNCYKNICKTKVVYGGVEKNICTVLRGLIKDEFKADVLTAGNDGTFAADPE